MHVIAARNVEEALYEGLHRLREIGHKRGSRNGEVIVMDGPVTTLYEEPRERVLLWPARDANPFFHLFESLWMLHGKRDVKSVAFYVRRMADFSDDGEIFHGAYGHRWKWHFGMDQLDSIRRRLTTYPDDRRCVLEIWDAREDLDVQSRDIPCNTQVFFSRNYLGELDMTVCCRSNDIIWGAYGANAVHFSMLQEFMAAGIGCEVGRYWQMSNNYHAYTKTFDPLVSRLGELLLALHTNPYKALLRPYPLVSTDWRCWEVDLAGFMGGQLASFGDPFFNLVAVPMRRAYQLYREGRLEEAIDIASTVRAQDWNIAAVAWLERRLARRKS